MNKVGYGTEAIDKKKLVGRTEGLVPKKILSKRCVAGFLRLAVRAPGRGATVRNGARLIIKGVFSLKRTRP